MTDSDDPLADKHERNRARRIEEIERWVEYIRDNPPEVWGEQLNTLIESQIEAARKSGVSAEQRQRVREAGREFAERESE
jgi:hypothetical protein